MTALATRPVVADEGRVGAPDPSAGTDPGRRRPLRHRAAQRWPVATFLVLALVLSWWPAFGRIDNPEAAVVLPIGPSIAGLLVAGWRAGPGARRAILRSTVTWRGLRGWPVLALPFVAAVGAVAVGDLAAGTLPSSASVMSSLLILAVLPFTAIVSGPLGEELGWRGFLLPHLLETHSPISATVRLFPLWVLFHFPLVLTEPDRFGLAWLVTVGGLSVSLTWLHLRSGGSVALAVLFHALVNSTAGASIQLFDVADQPAAWTGLAGVWVVIAAALLAGPLRRASRGWRPSVPAPRRSPGGSPSTADATAAATADVAARSARTSIGVFLILMALVAGAAQLALLTSGRTLEDQALLVVLLMWSPALATFVVGRLRGERLPPGTFRLGGRRSLGWYAVAWLLPLGVGGVAYGTSWVFGWTPLDEVHGLAAVAVSLALSLTLLVPFSAATALGEEIGWRGFLLPRLAVAGVAHPVAVTNVIWWLFHVPIVLGGLYASGPTPLLAAVVFGATVTAVGTVAGWSRLATGSVWPAVLLHASWNAVIQGSFDVLTVGEGPRAAENVLVGESGVLVAGAAVAALVLLARWRRA